MLTMREVLIYFSVKYSGDWEKIKNALVVKEMVTEADGKEVLSKIPCKTLTFIDSDYPECLKQAYRPPFVLYYEGNIELLTARKKIGIIGSRKNSPYGEMVTNKLIGGIAEKDHGFIVVSGMANGIDSIAERCAIKNGLSVISILGCGIDMCYPVSSKDIYEFSKSDKGLLLSELPPTNKPIGSNFPMRNRILSGIIDTLLIVEAKQRSGTSITARLSLEDNKDILCVPCDITSSYKLTNHLIRDGAISCLSSEDIIEAMERF